MQRIRALLTALVVGAVAYTAAAWLIGFDVQKQMERREQRALKNAPYVELLRRDYHRGIFGSTEELTYGLRGPLATWARLLATAGPEPALRLTVRNTIRHGPLPGLRSVALAVIDTELVAPPEIQAKLQEVFGSRPAVSIHTRLGWLGNAATQLSSPAFRTQLPSGGTVSGSGVTVSIEASRDLAAWRAHLESGGFSAQGPQARAALGGIRLDADMRRLVDPLYVGDFDLSLQEARLETTGTPPVRLSRLSVRGSSSSSGDYVDTGFDVTTDQVAGSAFSLSRLEYAFRFEHLQATALASFTQALRDAQASGAPGSPALAAAAVRDAFDRYGIELLLHDPVIEIPRVGFSMPEGEFRLQAKLAAHGLRREDLSGPAMVPALLTHVDGTADLRVDAALLTRLSNGARGPALSAQLDALQRQGYLKQEGAAWTAHLAYRGGKLTINDLPYPPAGP